MTNTRQVPAGLLTAEEAAQWMCVSRAHFYKLQIRKIVVGPQCVRYDVRDLQSWADAHGNVDPMRKVG